jgi:chromosome partitioning protein
MKTITVSNQKGGTGKTSVALHLAMYLAEAGKSVLFVDTDPQGNASKTFAEQACGVVASSLFAAGPVQVVANENITLIAADAKMADMERAKPQVVNYFKKQMAGLSGSFDFCIIDTPPSLGLRMTAALVVADFVLSPIELEEYSIDGIKMMLQTIFGVKQKYNPKLNFLGMLPNRFNSRSTRQKETFADLVKNYSELLIPAKVGFRGSIPEALAEGVPVWKLKKSAAKEAGREFKKAFEIIFDKIGGLK